MSAETGIPEVTIVSETVYNEVDRALLTHEATPEKFDRVAFEEGGRDMVLLVKHTGACVLDKGEVVDMIERVQLGEMIPQDYVDNEAEAGRTIMTFLTADEAELLSSHRLHEQITAERNNAREAGI